jgi:hypothetical protein
VTRTVARDDVRVALISDHPLSLPIISDVEERVLTQRELNRSMLARQLLLERTDLSITDALEQVGGLQTQYSPSGYIGLWTRLRNFARESLTDALYERRVVQATLIRTTIHTVSAADYWLFARGSRSARRDWWLRVQSGGFDRPKMEKVAAALRDFLGDGPRRQPEVLAFLDRLGYPRAAWSGVGLWLDLVRVPPSGTWARRRADIFGLAEDWVGPSDAAEDDGLETLVRRYLGGFGPAPVTDIASWAGVPATTIKSVVDRLDLANHLRDEAGRVLLDVPGAPLPDVDTHAPVRMIPTFDAMLMIHARRTGVLPEVYRPVIFNTKTPQSVPTFMVDGRVAGTWRYRDGRVMVEPFERLSRAAQQELDTEVERLAAFHAE